MLPVNPLKARSILIYNQGSYLPLPPPLPSSQTGKQSARSGLPSLLPPPPHRLESG